MVTPKQIYSLVPTAIKYFHKTLNQVFYGMTAYELEQEFRKERNNLNNLLMLMIYGDLAGLPFFPSYYSMRILPYIIPLISRWKRSLYRERDITDIIATDI